MSNDKYNKVPKDIILPMKYNADERFVIADPFSNFTSEGVKAMAGPANYGYSLIEFINAKIESGEIEIIINNNMADTFKVKVTTNDTTEEFLFTKILVEPELTKVETNDSGNEKLTLSLTDNGTDFSKLQQIASSRLLGRYNSGTGNIEQISLGSGFSLTGGILNYTESSIGSLPYFEYSATNGAYVKVLGGEESDVTFARTSATEGTFTIPDGVYLLSASIHHTAVQNPGQTYYIQFDFQGTRNTNTTISNLLIPDIRVANKFPAVLNSNTVDRSNVIPYNKTINTANLDLSVTGLDPLEIKLDNYNSATSSGTEDSLIQIIF